MLDWIKEGRSGPWAIENFEISKMDATIYAIGCYGTYEIAPHPGRYTRLIHDKRGVIMSDTRQELLGINGWIYEVKHLPVSNAHINGLGLGIVTKGILDLGWIVEVCEVDEDVIDLVGSQLLLMFPDRLNIIHADALSWKPPKGTRYGAVFHDIWDVCSIDNWGEYNLLMRRWGHWTSCQGAWARDRLKMELKKDQRWR